MKHKARLMTMSFLKRQGLDYFELFAPVARHETISLVVALTCSIRWNLSHLNVKSAFLNGPLDEEVYVYQPPGFEVKGNENMVYRLYKALYDLKHVSRVSNKRIDVFFISHDFKKMFS